MSRLRAAGGRGLLLAVVAVLGGCPLSSDKPLSDPRAASPDPVLVGTWRTQDPESGEWNQLTILAFDEHQMVGFAPENGSSKVTFFRLFVTPVGTERFLNAQELGSDDAGWSFASYRISGDHMRMKVVDDTLFDKKQFATSVELARFIGLHLADPLLYAAEGEQPSEMAWERVQQPADAPKPKS